MNKNLNILYGIIGGLILILLKLPIVNLLLGSFNGYITEFIINLISIFGFIFVIYFSILLIINALKYVYKRNT
jgi:hypothetical protein